MIPIIYDDLRLTRGVVPTDAGNAQLVDTIECTVTEQRNESYELQLLYPGNGRNVDEIQLRRLILAKANPNDPLQLFRIYKIIKQLNGYYTVHAQHITYDLCRASIFPGASNVAANCADACAILSTGTFPITTDITTAATFAVTEPGSKRSWMGGRDGSLLDVYGGEFYYNNYSVQLLQSRGSEKNFVIRYGQNMTQLTQELDASQLATDIRLYYAKSDGTFIRSQTTPTGLTLDFNGTIYIDVTSEFAAEPTVATLNTRATQYVQEHPELTNPQNSLDCDFLQLPELYQEKVGLCDTIRLYYEKFDINVYLKVIETTYDTLNEKYTNLQVGDPKPFFIK